MLVRWSSQEEFTKFAPTYTNTAGDQRLEIGTKIVAMTAAREETIISTDEAIYGMTFIGGDFVFSFRLLATDSGAAGLNTMLGVDGDVYWMGKRTSSNMTALSASCHAPCNIMSLIDFRHLSSKRQLWATIKSSKK
jgi:hypothetical protein